MPEVSIIVTTYNIEGYVKQCLDCLTSQTLTDIEIIVVDDGSSDGTVEVIESCAQVDPRIRLIALGENTIGGVATPANVGLDAATAPYVGFADGDDFSDPQLFEKLLLAAKEGDHDLSMCKYKLLDESTEELSDPAESGRWLEITKDAYDLDDETRKQFLRFIAVPWRKLYKRSLLEDNEIRFPVGDYFYEDNPFHWFVLTKAKSIAVVPEVLCYHRVSRAGQTMASADERLFKIFKHHDTISAWLKQHGIEPVFRSTLISWVIAQMSWISVRTPKELRQSLYDALAPIFKNYTDADVSSALKEGKQGAQAKRLCDALRRGNFAQFDKQLDARKKSNSLFAIGLHHLRYSGVRHTSGLVSRYVSERLRKRIKTQGNKITGRKPTDVTNEDLMLGLVILQRQVKSLESRLREIEEKGRDT